MTTAYDYDAPETITGGSDLVSKPGTYNLVVMQCLSGMMPDGKKVLEGGGFSVNFSVLAGTVEGQVDKPLNLIFGNPKVDATEKAKGMSAAKKGAFFIATDLMTPAQLGQKGLKIDLELSQGRQVIATLEADDREGKENFLRLSYANMYHVDDPRAASFPKSAEALALIPKAQRHDAAYFAPLQKKKDAANPAAPARQSRLSKAELDDM